MKLVEMIIKANEDEVVKFQPKKIHRELVNSQIGDMDSSMLAGIIGVITAIYSYGIPDDLDELMEVL